MSKRNSVRDVNGNSIASAAAFERDLAKKGSAMLRFEQCLESLEEAEIYVEGLNVRLPGSGRSDVLVVVKATNGQQRWVVFCSGESLVAAIMNFVGRHQSGTLEWKEDQYAK